MEEAQRASSMEEAQSKCHRSDVMQWINVAKLMFSFLLEF